MTQINPFRTLLVSHGYTLQRLAKDTGIHYWIIADASRGVRPLSTWERARVAEVLGLRFGDVPEMGPARNPNGSAGAAAVVPRD